MIYIYMHTHTYIYIYIYIDIDSCTVIFSSYLALLILHQNLLLVPYSENILYIITASALLP